MMQRLSGMSGPYIGYSRFLCVDFVYKIGQFREVRYLPSTVRDSFSGVGVGGFQDRDHAYFQGRENVLVDAVPDVGDVLGRFADVFGGDPEELPVGLAKIVLVGVQPHRKKLKDPHLFQMSLEGMTADKGIRNDAELEPQSLEFGQCLSYVRLDRSDLAQRLVPQPRKLLPLVPVEPDSLFCADPSQQGRRIEVIPRDIGDQVPNAQRDEVPPAVVFETADCLATTLEIFVRQPRSLAKEPCGAESSEVEQGFTQIEQDRLDFASLIWHHQSMRECTYV